MLNFNKLNNMIHKFLRISILMFVLIFLYSKESNSQSREMFKDKGVLKITSISFYNGFGDIEYGDRKMVNYQSSFAIHQVIGNIFNSHFSLGFGIGFERWNQTSFIPMYADIRVNLLKGRYSPHLYADLGYATKWYQSPKPDSKYQVVNGAKQGIYAEGGVGFKAMINNYSGIIFTACYKVQESEIFFSDEKNIYPAITTNQTQRILYNFFGARVAYQF